MAELVIDRDIIIDDVSFALTRIRSLSGRTPSDLCITKRFVQCEKNTKYYLDKKLNSSIQEQPNSVYVWIDTGYTDFSGNPLFASLTRKNNKYYGHIIGTIATLADNAGEKLGLSHNEVRLKVEILRKKYKAKVEERTIKHILDEQRFLIESVNQRQESSYIATKLKALDLVFPEDIDNKVQCDESFREEEQKSTYRFSEFEEKITIDILLEKMERMQANIDELLAELEIVSSESREKIEDLQSKNAEYMRVIMQMREFSAGEESSITGERKEQLSGHYLLKPHGKILIIGGQELGVNVMYGIAKSMGFNKRDLVFVDYDKAKEYTDRIRKEGKYSAVIFGACPHKTKAGSGYSSAIEKFKSIEGMPYTTDARSKSGKLKVTKESFRNALYGVCERLKTECAC